MELLFVVVGAAIVGFIVRYSLSGRSIHGVFAIPAIAVVSAAIIWSALTWLGWAFDGGWIWAVTIVVTIVASVAAALVIPPRRRASDERELERLKRA